MSCFHWLMFLLTYVTESLGSVPVSGQVPDHLGQMFGLLKVEGEANSSRSLLSLWVVSRSSLPQPPQISMSFIRNGLIMVYYSFSCIPHMEEVSSSIKIFACFKIGYTLYCQAVRSSLCIKYAYPTPTRWTVLNILMCLWILSLSW